MRAVTIDDVKALFRSLQGQKIPRMNIPKRLWLTFINFFITIGFFFYYLFFNDRDLKLALCERFGRGISVYSGKVVWLTGATTGLGEQMAYKLAAVGAKLILSGRNREPLITIKDACLEHSKGKLNEKDILTLPFDFVMADPGTVKEAIKCFGHIDVFICNVGHVQIGDAALMDMQVSRALFDVNFFGCIFLTQQLLTHFLTRGNGQIVVLSAMAGKFGIPGLAVYSASKHALHGYFDALRVEYNPYNIHITIACPGFYQTSISDTICLVGREMISVGEQEKIRRISMKASRCAKLVLVAAANKLNECWVANQPFLFLMALAQYFPGMHKSLMKTYLNKDRVAKIYKGKWPNLLTWKPLFAI